MMSRGLILVLSLWATHGLLPSHNRLPRAATRGARTAATMLVRALAFFTIFASTASVLQYP